MMEFSLSYDDFMLAHNSWDSAGFTRLMKYRWISCRCFSNYAFAFNVLRFLAFVRGNGSPEIGLCE